MRASAPFELHKHILHGVALGSAIASISTLQYFTAPSHLILHAAYAHLYYVPIVLAAFWYGIPGGVLTGLVCLGACLFHVEVAWRLPYGGRYIEAAVLPLLGAAVGAISSHARRDARRYRAAVATLADANRQLHDSEQHYRRADRLSALGAVAAGLAHEMRGPLAGLGAALDMVSARGGAPRMEADVTRLARRELNRLNALVSEFVAFARPSEPRLCETNLRDVIDQAVARVDTEAERSAVSIEVDCEPSLPPLVADAEQVRQVVVNIVLNAVQASMRGGKVNVRVRRERGCQAIDVLDEGPGIAREYEDRIFEPFFTTKERGVGLGLAISQRIVEAHYGAIEVRRRLPAGTVVHVELPEISHQAATHLPGAVEAHG